ncbi:MAG: hypothetical protein JSS34_07690 [Proteobacteria bacterium]|nr:hypothetical protein [Pseudomonadota bacterium]
MAYVKKILAEMFFLDQEARNLLIHDLENPIIGQLLMRIDRFHMQKMKEILKHYGWITISKFGPEADYHAWMLVQHADEDANFQAGCLFVLSQLLKTGETNKKNYAYLYDRVALKFQYLGMKQRYGTQVSVSKNGFEILPFEGTMAELNQRRFEMGLTLINSYLEEIKKSYQR